MVPGIYFVNADGSGATGIVVGPESEDASPYWATLDASDSIFTGADPGDGDGVPDGPDAFPLNPDETVDTDGDGTGDRATSTTTGTASSTRRTRSRSRRRRRPTPIVTDWRQCRRRRRRGRGAGLLRRVPARSDQGA